MKPLRIATRQSPLALWQAEYVSQSLSAIGIATELVPMVSGGDTDMRPIDGTRQVGVFTKRIQEALLNDEGDIAVHSLKDLPTETNERLMLAAVPQRETVQDSLVSQAGWTFEQVPNGAKIGTGSRRRAAQILNKRPDLVVEPIRGNVQTRLAKLDSKEFDAIVLAEAGIVRLEMLDLSRSPFDRLDMLPAPGQGALGIEVRSDDQLALEAAEQLNHTPTRAAVTAERLLLAALHGGCLAPIAAFGEVSDRHIELTAVVLSEQGKTRLDEYHRVAFDETDWRSAAERLADQVSQRLIARGARELILDGRRQDS
jgi:hydroxymethylbilane synthase